MKAAVPFCVALALTASATAQELPAKVLLGCSRGFVALLADIHAKSNPRLFEDTSEIAIQIPDEHAIYAITKPGHYAHPAIVLTQFDVGQHGTITHDSCAYGSKEAFARYLKEFELRDLAQVSDGPAPARQP